MRLLLSLSLLLTLSLLTPHLISAQTLVYPVRSGHKWGYVNSRGKMMIKPRYEAFSESDLPWNIHPEPSQVSPSPFRLVESGGKVGMTDRSLREVLPCRYKRIRPLSQHWFAVEEDSLFTLVNRKGETVISEKFDDICATDTLHKRRADRFFVKKNGLWGVYQLPGGLVVQPQYDDIASAYSPQYFRAKPSGSRYWGLINLRNERVLPPDYTDIRAISKDFIAVLQEGQNWLALDERGTPLFEPNKWVRLEILNRHHVWLQDIDQRSALWNVSQRRWVTPNEGGQQASAYFPMDDRFIAPFLFNARGLIDSNGQMLVPPRFYDSITLSGLPDFYRARSFTRNWGLLRARDATVALSCRFNSLEPFRDSLSIVCGDIGCGVINGRLQQLIVPTFERIEREGDTLNVYGKKDELLRYKIERGGQLTLLESFEDVLQIRIGLDQNFVEARPFRGSRFANVRTRNGPAGFYLNISRDSSLWWKNDFGSWRLLRRRNGEYVERLYAQLAFEHMEPLTPQDLCAVYRSDLTVKGRLAQLYGKDRGVLSRIALFRFSTGKFVSGPDFQGIRIEDFKRGYPCAVFIDTLGRMGLVDQLGMVRTQPDGSPLRFTYIGDFSQGKARVCVGGVLRRLEADEDYPPVEVHHLFAARYGLREPGAPGQEYASARPLVVVPTEKSRPRWGFIDTLGRVLMQPEYDFAEDYDPDTMAVVHQNKLMGLVDSAGLRRIECKYLRIIAEGRGIYKVAVKNPYLFYYNQQGHQYCVPRYDRYLGFSEGLCGVRRDSVWGFIDSTGRERIACRFAAVRHFSEGQAAVLENGTWVFIDSSGQQVFSTGLGRSAGADLGSFVGGLCHFRQNRRWGFYGPQGKEQISPKYLYASDFCRGTAVVRPTDRFGLIDTAGRYLLPPTRFVWIGAFNELGLAQVREKADGPVGLVNTKAQIVVEPTKYIQIDSFFGGCARVRSAAGWGLINAQGRELIAPGAYAGLSRASEGVLAALPHLQTEWIYVDTLNHRIINAVFTAVSPFQSGYALVNENKIISRRGFQRLPPGLDIKFQAEGIFGMESFRGAYFGNAAAENLFGRYFEDVKPFENGIGKVKKQGKWGAVNRRGVALVRPKFNFVHPQRDGNLIVRPPNLFGLVDKSGKTLVPPDYDSIEWLEGNVFKLELGEQVGYLRRNGQWMWPMGN